MKRFFPRYTVRGLAVAVLLVAIVMGWLVHERRRIERQREILAQIRERQSRLTEGHRMELIDPLRVVSRTLPWYLNWDGQRVFEEVVGLGFDLGQYDEHFEYPTDISDADLRTFSELSGLRRLDIPRSKVTDAGLAHLARLKNLEDLDLSQTAITDEGLAHLARLKNLAKLDLSHTAVTDEGFQHLGRIRQLSELKLGGVDVTGEGFPHLARCPAFERLTLWDLGLTSAGADYLNEITSLRELTLSQTPLERLHLHDLAHLEYVSISRDFSEVTLERLPKLEELHLHFDVLERLELRDLPRLNSMQFVGNSIPEAAFEDIGGLGSLRELLLSDLPVSDASLMHLRELDRLETLFLFGGEFGNEAMAAFEGMPRLKHLRLNGHTIDEQGLDRLGVLTNLEELLLKRFRTARHCNEMFRRLTRLRELKLVACQFGELSLSGELGLENLEGDETAVGTLRLEDLPKLRRIRFHYIGLDELSLQRLPALEWASFTISVGSQVSPVTLRDLPMLETLKFVGYDSEGGIERLREPVLMSGDLFDHVDTIGSPEIRIHGVTLPEEAQRKYEELRK